MNALASLFHNNFQSAMEVIARGDCRPDESFLRAMITGKLESHIKYVARLGIPISQCSIHTAKVFPELLDLLKDPIPKQVSFPDVVKNPSIYMSSDLLTYTIDVRPDLFDCIRRLVIENDYVDLFEKFDIRPDELIETSSIVRKDIHFLKAYVEKHNTTLEIFYPTILVRDRAGEFDKFCCPEFIQYCTDNWNDVQIKTKMCVVPHISPEIAARLLLGDIEKIRTETPVFTPNHCYDLAFCYRSLPEMSKFIEFHFIGCLTPVEHFFEAVEEMREKYI